MLPAPRHDLQSAVQRVEDLKVVPEVALRIQGMARDPEATPRDLEQLIRTEPGLSARLLRLANSPLYGRRRTVTELGRGIQILGFDVVCDLALALAMASIGRKHSLQGRLCWEHGVRHAVAARALAYQVHGAVPDRAFTTALLADLGKLLLLELEAEAYEPLLTTLGMDASLLLRGERFHLGFDHGALGSACLARWSLPDASCHVVELHHQRPADDCPHWPLHGVVHVAEDVATWLERGVLADGVADRLLEHLMAERLGLEPAASEAMAAELPGMVKALLDLLK